MIYSYVGVIKKNSKASKVLVRSNEDKYYVWSAENPQVKTFHFVRSGWLPSTELQLATPRQIEAGRGSLWSPNQSMVMEQMVFHGVVSGGKVNRTILVKYPEGVPNQHYFIYAVPLEALTGLSVGAIVSVDTRYMWPARQDHIEAGLGHGKLRRKKRVPVS